MNARPGSDIPAAAPVSALKPLYIQGRPGVCVRLDGPALRVSVPERSPVLYPLRRLERVVVSGPVEWATEALLACAERGVPITFLTRAGEVRAYLFGWADGRQGLAERLRALFERPDWQERYADWVRSMESRGRVVAARRLGIAPDALAPERMAVRLAELRARASTPGIGRYAERRLKGMLGGLVSRLLADMGLDAAGARDVRARVPLGEDLVRVLFWRLEAPVLQHLQARPRGETDDAALVRLFEAFAPALWRAGMEALNHLQGRLLELAA